jgi:hypothetical protein
LNLNYKDFVIVTNSSFAKQIFKKSIVELIPDDYSINPVSLRKKIESILQRFQIDEIYIDAFPAGITGELNDLQTGNCKLNYVARILNWNSYQSQFENFKLKFEKSYLVEELPEDQFLFIESCSKELISLDLYYPVPFSTNFVRKVLYTFKDPLWLIVHSGPFDELELLYFHALEIADAMKIMPEFLIISKVERKIKGNNLKQIDYFPASDFFPYVEKIITSCGFNVMHQTKAFSDKHIFIPFSRRFDDQFLRAKRRKDMMLKSL